MTHLSFKGRFKLSMLDYFHEKWLKEGDFPFVSFMQAALYAPNAGYYSSGAQVLGQAGDFITAPELTPLFGQTLASQCHQVLAQLDDPIIFEFGAGSGRLCVDVLTQLQQLNGLPKAYHILEVSGHLKARQQTLVRQEIPELYDRVKWLSQWPEESFNGVILANEVLDAMPVHRFLQSPEGVMESHVRWTAQHQLQEVFKPCVNARLRAYIHENVPVCSEYASEVNLLIDDWFQHCFEMLKQGVAFIIDYGFPRHEFYHPDRHQGTLMCHYRHQAHTDFLAHPGEQDITAHVDFTHVAEAADHAGFHVAGYTNQASFLLSNGLLQLLELDPTLANQNSVKQLIQPHEMGELFKVIALTKNWVEPLNGFQLNDKRVSL